MVRRPARFRCINYPSRSRAAHPAGNSRDRFGTGRWHVNTRCASSHSSYCKPGTISNIEQGFGDVLQVLRLHAPPYLLCFTDYMVPVGYATTSHECQHETRPIPRHAVPRVLLWMWCGFIGLLEVHPAAVTFEVRQQMAKKDCEALGPACRAGHQVRFHATRKGWCGRRPRCVC